MSYTLTVKMSFEHPNGFTQEFGNSLKRLMEKHMSAGKVTAIEFRRAYYKEHEVPEPTYKELLNKERAQDSQCTHCPPNKGENAKRKPKHGKAKSKK